MTPPADLILIAKKALSSRKFFKNGVTSRNCWIAECRKVDFI